jgi:hypothetical protein
MTPVELKPAASPPPRSPFQFGLRTLLLLFVVLGSSMAVFGTWGIFAFALTVVLAVYLGSARSLRPLAYGAVLIVSVIAFVLIGCFLYESNDVGPHYRPSCLNRMHQLSLALRDYHEEHGHFPPAYITDKNGKPLHSWRTLILPYMEYEYLYRTFNLNQPWDAPKHRVQRATSLREFICPTDFKLVRARRCPNKLLCCGRTKRRMDRRQTAEAR